MELSSAAGGAEFNGVTLSLKYTRQASALVGEWGVALRFERVGGLWAETSP